MFYRGLNALNSTQLKEGGEDAIQALVLSLDRGTADIDGDGLVSRIEFLIAGGTEHMFGVIDRDGDGFIDRAEIQQIDPSTMRKTLLPLYPNHEDY